ncbi:hypothetical protein ACEPAG_6744 [Sanghuangporus baumii]
MTRAFWTSGDKATLIEHLLVQMKDGRDADNSFKPAVWTEAAVKLNETRARGAPKTAKNCKKQFEELSRQCRRITELRGFSGFGFDDATNTVTAPPDVWKNLIEKHPKYSNIQNMEFPLYYDICKIIEGKAADGRDALSISTILNKGLEELDVPDLIGSQESCATVDVDELSQETDKMVKNTR